jgi:mRNA interferase MazF
MRSNRPIKRGDIWWIDWNPGRGVEQVGRRPSLVVQDDIINEENTGSVIVLALSTGSHGDDALHVAIEPSRLNGLSRGGVIKCEQLMTVSTDRFETYSGILEPRQMSLVEHALKMILRLR